jgi:hypothetical protein
MGTALEVMKRFIPIVMALLLSRAAFGEPATSTVTKIVSCFISPKILPDSFAAKPKTIYIGGDRYSRVEEQLDAAHGIHGLIIVSEPDSWMINLVDNTARHIDGWKTFNTLRTFKNQGDCMQYLNTGK